MMAAGMFPTHEKDMYIWNTVADSARGVASPRSRGPATAGAAVGRARVAVGRAFAAVGVGLAVALNGGVTGFQAGVQDAASTSTRIIMSKVLLRIGEIILDAPLILVIFS